MAIDHVQLPPGVDPTGPEACAQLFHALADPNRLAILQHLACGPHRVRDLVDHMGFAQSTVSKHLGCLRDCGLIELRSEGRASWFSLADQDALAEVMVSAEAMLRSTENQGTQVVRT